MITVVLVTAAIVLILVVEAAAARHARTTLPLRIHVNGTRGKSTVALYVAAALRAHGKRTLCKVTGIEPTFVLPDGTRKRIRRRGRARIQEQWRSLMLARRLRCDTIVFECMSISPLLQKAETSIIRPHVSILTNVLDDHREELGMTEKERVAGFLSALPGRCTIVSGEDRNAAAVARAAHRVRSRIIVPEPGSAGDTPPAAFQTNVSIALAACRELGLDERVCFDAITKEIAQTLPPAWTHAGERDGISFLNGLAANDVASTEALLSRWTSEQGGWSHLVILLNTRADRPLRTREFCRWCATMPGTHDVILTGTHRLAARRWLRQGEFPQARVAVWSSRDARRSGEILLSAGYPRRTLVAAVGNIAGDGFHILEGVQEWLSKPSSSVS